MISAYFNIVSHTMSQMFVRGVAEIAEALVAFRRLQNFLEYEEKDDLNKKFIEGLSNGDEKLKPDSTLQPDEAVVIRNLTARWIPLSKLENGIAAHKLAIQNGIKKNGHKENNGNNLKMEETRKETDAWKLPTLQNISVNIKKGTLVGIVGHVGSGKTSFLQALLRELPMESGSVALCGSVSYASQEPWVFAGSAKQNILFGQKINQEHYDATIKACALPRDFEQFEFGDKTIIGERGTSLSGGQKARLKCV